MRYEILRHRYSCMLTIHARNSTDFIYFFFLFFNERCNKKTMRIQDAYMYEARFVTRIAFAFVSCLSRISWQEMLQVIEQVAEYFRRFITKFSRSNARNASWFAVIQTLLINCFAKMARMAPFYAAIKYL